MVGRQTYVAEELDGSSHSTPTGVPVDLCLPDRPGLVLDDVDDGFKASMALLACGVVIVTTWHEGRHWGLTISSCCSISVAPARVFISVGRHTTTHANIAYDGTFGINILGGAAKEAALTGAIPGTPKFMDDLCTTGCETDAPVLDGALAHLDCIAETRRHVGDHVLVVGRVRRVQFGNQPCDPGPLVYFKRNFWELGNCL